MSDAQALQRMAKRLAHVEGHREVNEEEKSLFVSNIENNRGDPTACFGLLSNHALASAVSEWFTHHDLASMRQWCYVASKLDEVVYERSSDQFGPGGKMLQLLKPLLANHRDLINWFASYDRAYDMHEVEDHRTHDFWAYQARIALRGDWGRLIKRCEIVINDPPRAAPEQKYLIDHHFYLALARRDLGRVQQVLQELVTPQMLRARAKDESGYTADLISTPAVIYAKIAWLHGCEVTADTPYIPAEWLPTDPLPRYDNHYRFLK